MKFVFSLSVLIVSLFSSFSGATGGVDVGNGGQVYVGLNEGFYPTEDALVYQVKGTLEEVRVGTHSRVRRWIQQGQCDPIMKYESTEVIESYQQHDGRWVKGVVGYTKIVLKNCKTPENIQADKPPEENRRHQFEGR